ncbi:uncharacterized protein LOC134188856 isoform X2 [Corticium candelabrum]|nr:uncharacterized protein LOC134188856 isoform X2 [Corticium candelabrum]
MEAARSGNMSNVDRLLNTGMDVNSRNVMGYAALREAVVNNHESVCRVLLDRGARVDDRDDMGWTALHWAATRGHESIASLLLERRADVNAKNNDGDTPAHKAGSKGHLGVLRVLVDGGADLLIANVDEKNVLEVAEERRMTLEQRREVNEVSPEDYRKREETVKYIRTVSRESSRLPSTDSTSSATQQSAIEKLTDERNILRQEFEELCARNTHLEKVLHGNQADRVLLDDHIEDLMRHRELAENQLEEISQVHRDVVDKLREELEKRDQDVRIMQDDFASLNEIKVKLEVQLSILSEEVHCLRGEKYSLEHDLSDLKLEHDILKEQFTDKQSLHLANNDQLRVELQEVRGTATVNQMLLAVQIGNAHSAKTARNEKDKKLQTAEAEYQVEAMHAIDNIEALQSQLAHKENKIYEIQVAEAQKTTLVERYRNENEALTVEVQRLTKDLEDKQNDHDRIVDEMRTESQQRQDEVSEDLRLAQEQITQLTRDMEVMTRQKANAEAAIVEFERVVQQSTDTLMIPETELQLTGKTIGKGSFAEVKAGCWQGSEIAVKTLHANIDSSYNRSLFLQEILMCSRVRHPHVVAIFGITRPQDATPSIILELLEGSLADVLSSAHSSNQYLTFREQVDISVDCLSGLSHLHEFQPNPLLHGDLRPTNVLLTNTMRAKIGDLGAAHFSGVSLSLGPVSPEYLAPERSILFRGGHSHNTTSADMYSMGVTLSEIMTGSFPDRNSIHRQFRRISHDQLRDLCLCMTDADPLQRPTARHVLVVMQSLRDDKGYASCPPKRIVKGKRYGDRVVLTDRMW